METMMTPEIFSHGDVDTKPSPKISPPAPLIFTFPHGDMETTTSKAKAKLSPVSHSTWGYGKLKYSAPA